MGTVGLMLALLGVALILFWVERIPADLVALGLLLTLALTGLLPADRAFAGFSSDTVLTLLGLLVMTGALMRTGGVDMAGRAILRVTGNSPRRLLVTVMGSTAGLSAFISNTASTAFFLPTVLGIARRARISPSKLLMPLAFASILTSSVTLVSTSTNLVVSGLMQQSGLEPLSMFELAPVGVPIAIAGLAYMLLIGIRMVPERAPVGGDDAAAELREFLTELVILPESRLAGKTIADAGLGRDHGITVLGIERDGTRRLMPEPSHVLVAGDLLLVEGAPSDLAEAAGNAGVEIHHEAELSSADIQDAGVKLAEAVILPGSRLVGRQLRHLEVRARFGVQVLAVRREGRTMLHGLRDVRLRIGDTLLLQGERTRLRELAEAETLRLVGEAETMRPHKQRALIAALAFVGAITLASLGWASFPVAMLLGALVAMGAGCISPEAAYRQVHWRSLVLIACMLGVGQAMDGTGTAAYLARGVAGMAGQYGQSALLAGMFALTVILTQPLSNQAAAAIVLPISVQLARELSLDPRPFAVIIAVAASCSYLTPLEPSCLMVHGPGRYRFSDFIKVGAPLTVIIGIIAIVLVPMIW